MPPWFGLVNYDSILLSSFFESKQLIQVKQVKSALRETRSQKIKFTYYARMIYN